MNQTYTLDSSKHELLKNEMLEAKIVCVVANYGFAENASRLKAEMSKSFLTYLIDSSSPVTPTGTDVVIPNNYYPGLLKAAIKIAESGDFEWLLFIASDVEIPDPVNFQMRVLEVICDSKIGVYSPTVTASSRTAYHLLVNQPTGSLREVGMVEGFIFLTQVKLLDCLSVPLEKSKFGWAFDLFLCYNAYVNNKVVIADDRNIVYHPKSKSPIHEELAMKEALELIPKHVFEWKRSTQAISRLPRGVKKALTFFVNASFLKLNPCKFRVRKK